MPNSQLGPDGKCRCVPGTTDLLDTQLPGSDNYERVCLEVVGEVISFFRASTVDLNTRVPPKKRRLSSICL